MTSVGRGRLSQQQRGRRGAEAHEIFMLIVAKLPTKDYKRHVMRSCQAACCHYDGESKARARSAAVPDGAPQKVGAPLKIFLMKGWHQENVRED